jgi:ribosomal subunit interface protein
MDISIKGRHTRVGDSLRAQAEFRMERMQRLEDRITAATITFESANTVKSAEARLAVAGGPPVISHGEGATLRNALDAAMDRIERQLKRRRQRARTGRTREVRIRAVEDAEGLLG